MPSIWPAPPARVNFSFLFMSCRVRSDFETVDNLALHQVGIDDFIDVAGVDVGVPGAFGIDHQHRAFFAAVQAARRLMRTWPWPLMLSSLQRFLACFCAVS